MIYFSNIRPVAAYFTILNARNTIHLIPILYTLIEELYYYIVFQISLDQ